MSGSAVARIDEMDEIDEIEIAASLRGRCGSLAITSLCVNAFTADQVGDLPVNSTRSRTDLIGSVPVQRGRARRSKSTASGWSIVTDSSSSERGSTAVRVWPRRHRSEGMRRTAGPLEGTIEVPSSSIGEVADAFSGGRRRT